MEEAAEGSCSVSSLPWAKLVPIDSKLCDVEIKLEETVVKSATEDDGVEREWCKIIRTSDRSSATIQNVSWSAIVVDGGVVEKGEEGAVRCGTEIVAAPHSQRGVTYRFKVMPPPLRLRPHQHPSQQLRIAVDADEAKCGICLSVWHDAVTLAPCFHNFCNGCFSEWLRRSHAGRVLCPHCRALVQFAGRNHFLHNIAREILNADPSLMRSSDEVATLDATASIQSNLVIKTGNRNQRRKRPHSQSDEESHAMCPQCGAEFGGFRCNENTIHLQCQACGGMMPSRPPLPQHCIGCDRAFCGAYWHAQGVGSHATCSPHTFKPISERTVTRIPFSAHEKNRHEQDITAKCIGDMGRRLEDVVAEWVTKLERREIDRTGMGLNHAETITSETRVCNECYEKLVSFLLYCFRVALPKHVGALEGREDCWYGHACRTQHHNEQHARRRNHVCPPTRPSIT